MGLARLVEGTSCLVVDGTSVRNLKGLLRSHLSFALPLECARSGIHFQDARSGCVHGTGSSDSDCSGI